MVWTRESRIHIIERKIRGKVKRERRVADDGDQNQRERMRKRVREEGK